MPEYINHNGKIILSDLPSLHHDNRGFRYGDGLFETIRCKNSKPLWIQYHYNRLVKSAELLKIQLPAEWNKDVLEAQIVQLLQTNNHIQGARVRLSLYRGGKGFYRPSENSGKYLIESSPLADKDYRLNVKGKMLGVFTQIPKTTNLLSFIKSTNAQVYVLASIFAAEKQWDDCLILNESGNIAEASSSNLFMVKDTKLYTPANDQAGVDGVMKNVLLSLVKDLGYSVHDCVLHPDDLLDADEVFLTNSIQGIQWVKGYKTKRYYHTISSELVALLNEVVNSDIRFATDE